MKLFKWLVLTGFILNVNSYAIRPGGLLERTLGLIRVPQHPLNQPAENANILSHSPKNLGANISSEAQIAFVAVLLAQARLLNKSYDPNHFEFKDAFNPMRAVQHPIRCIDDCLIGHPGSGNQKAYGIMGTAWSMIPSIDSTFIAVDQAKRKMEAWMQWTHSHLQLLRNSQLGIKQRLHDLGDWIQSLDI